MSQWLALMELCDDLLDRLHQYGHAQYLDMKHAQEALRSHWRTRPHEVSLGQIATDKTKSLFSSATSKAALKLSGLLHVIGIAGAIHSQVIKYLFGMYFTHPGVFVGSILAAVVLQLGSEKIEESQLFSEIAQITKNLSTVTSNLHSHYTHASQSLVESFAMDEQTGSKAVV